MRRRGVSFQVIFLSGERWADLLECSCLFGDADGGDCEELFGDGDEGPGMGVRSEE